MPSDDVPEDIFEEVEKRLSITKVVSLLNENPKYVDIAEKAKEIQKRVIEMEKRKKYLKNMFRVVNILHKSLFWRGLLLEFLV